MKNFKFAIRTLNKALKEEQPETFSSSWILKNAQPAYHFFRLNCKTENGDIDWDIRRCIAGKDIQTKCQIK